MEEKGYYLEYLKRTARFPQSVYHRAKHEMVKRAVLSCGAGSAILDAGCGIGHITGPYCGKYKIFGLDEQPSAISYCQKAWKGTYVRGRLCDIPFEDNFFDLVFLLDVIEHLTDPVKTLRELERVMKPGGSILICTMNYSSPLWFVLEHAWHRFMGGTCKPYSKDVHPSPYTEKILREHCAGLFEDIDIQKRILCMELFLAGKKQG